jgi:glycosyltransferase involved in cell wall biosynthesis
MLPITALIHTENDALRLGRCLETLYPCEQIVVVDHGSRDETVQVAREYGARIVDATGEAERTGPPGLWPELRANLRADRLQDNRLQANLSTGLRGWIMCLDSCESLSESLAASLFEWKYEWRTERSSLPQNAAPSFSVFLREETATGWIENPTAQTRLVPPDWNRWRGHFPAHDQSAIALEGEVLRFVFP